ncbi:hypothetical protein RHAL1_00968 [Beijerinckiaceae bacterium RH AL1]|nr:hypothetical protein [Beijerinckiaceae bacterium]VVB43909.1 hypothetical protein RHCH11_RHCH11_00943 [Beijerinckiaceae bacterium RH CH11]VVB43936.1 hypothetical protein RHAL8_00940 [Beijerinckiaceae bacterium RH AL8]VVC54075.1 hypothetical protein RHAL1_00968 [Beijerinckiaceae bacterium RH AL1]
MTGSPCVFCYCFDRKNTLPAIVSAQSVIDTLESKRPVLLHMITTDLAFDISEIDTRGKDVRIEVSTIQNPFDAFPSRGHISPATFLRFVIAQYVDPAHGRVLYLDTDIVLRSDVTDLFDLDLKDTPVAAVPDYPLVLGDKYWEGLTFSYGGRTYRSPEYMTEVLGVDWKNFDYMSVGVLLIDLAKWPAVCDAAIDFMASKETLDFLDQDAISAVLKGNFTRLPPEYNAQSEIAFGDGRSFWDRLRGWGDDLHRIARIWRTQAKIVHYAGANKPWLEDAKPTALEGEWWRAARRSKVFDRVAHLAYREQAKVGPRRC